jgi:hypothetical protein
MPNQLFSKFLRLLTFAQGQNVKIVQMNRSFSPDQNQFVVMYLCGHWFIDKWNLKEDAKTTIHDFLGICAVAARYEIRSLLATALKNGSDFLDHCLTGKNGNVDDYALGEFLGYDWERMIADKRHHWRSIDQAQLS